MNDDGQYMVSKVESVHGECARCGAPLRANNSGSFCARCLLKRALLTLEAPEEESEEVQTPSTLLKKRQFAGYELLSELGRGGMGVVFKARQKQPERLVALKIIGAGELASPKVLARFKLEATTIAALHHPNIVPLFEYGQHEGWHFFSMQFVEGRTLGEALQKEPYPPEAAARQMLLIVRAVQHAHERAILHRDLKPSNILLDGSNQPHLTDFGLAKTLEHDSDLTLSHAVIGTPAYMSPEQAAGRTQEITTASDVYGLGAIFYEMLSGQPPFHAKSTPALLRKVMEEEPISPSKTLERGPRTKSGDTLSSGDTPKTTPQAGIPTDLEVICLKCLEKSPAKRYATAADFADDLERWLRHEPIAARPSGRLERSLKWMRREPASAALMIVLVLAALVISTGAWGFNRRLKRARLLAEQRARQSLEQVAREHLQEGASLSMRGDGLTALHPLAQAVPLISEFPALASNIRLRFDLVSMCSPRPVQAWNVAGLPTGLRISPDGSTLIVDRKGAYPKFFAMNGAGELHAELFKGPGSISGFHLSPDASHGLELRDEHASVLLWDLKRGQAKTLPFTGTPGPAGAFSADGKQVATGGREIIVWSVESGQPVGPPISIPSRCVWIVFSPNGGRLLTWHADNQARLWEWPSGRALGEPVPAPAFGSIYKPIFSPDGATTAITDNINFQIRSGDDFELIKTLPHPGVIFEASYSPDGQAIATASFKGGGRVWDGKTLEPLHPQMMHENGARTVAFSPDGQVLATGGFDYKVKLWRSRDRRQIGSLLPHAALVTEMAFSPDSRFLATASSDGLVRLWDVTGAPIIPLFQGSSDFGLVFSQDGKAFAAAETTNRWRLYHFKTGGLELSQTIESMKRSIVTWDAPRDKLATADSDGTIQIWNAHTGQEMGRQRLMAGLVSFRFSPDGKEMVLCADHGQVAIMDLQKGVLRNLPVNGIDTFYSVVWSPHGDRIVTGELGQVRVWDPRSLRQVGETIRAQGSARGIQFSPDGTRVVAAFEDDEIEPRVAIMIDPDKGAPTALLHHADGVRNVIFSPSGKKMVTIGEDNTARLWHPATGLPAGPGLRHEAMVRCAAFAPGEQFLVTGGNDHTLRFWDVFTGEALAPPLLLSSGVSSVGFTPGGTVLILGTVDGSVWRLSLKMEPRPLKLLDPLSILATAHQRAESSGLIPLPPEDVAAQSALVMANNPLTMGSAAWHELQASLAKLATNTFAESFHLERLKAASLPESDSGR